MEYGQLICQVGALMYQKGFVISTDGNLSVRTGENEILITPSGVCKGRMTADMPVTLDLEGNILAGDRHPSSEAKMHLAVYRSRPDIKAVVHAHPPASTTFAVLGRPLDQPYLPEIALGLGTVPVAPYATPSTREVPDSILPYLAGHRAVLLANHGVLCWGADLWSAFGTLETVEFTADLYQRLHLMGGAQPLPLAQLQRLEALRGVYSDLSKKRGDC